jgi:3',5'-cyclic AMP phosphodiesterase CpdA
MPLSDKLGVAMRVTLVHLSDIHFTVGVNAIHGKLRHLAAAICSTDPLCNQYLIVLSGDITYNGTAEEYQVASQFLASLKNFVIDHNHNAVVHYVAVPGNHDCYLPEGEVNLRAALVGAVVPSLQTDAPDRSILESVLGCQRRNKKSALSPVL